MEGGKVILLVGPTCVGKTGAAVALAERLKTEIISADSMQVYRRMDIGTEKPTPEQRARVRHHMIDVVDPWDGFSAGRYIDAVMPLIEALHARGRVPLVTGGTGLYVKAMTRGLFKGPPADWDLREDLMAEDTGPLYEKLRSLDPEAAAGIMPTDKRRIVRALEVCINAGEKLSGMRERLTRPLPYEFVKVALSRQREELYPMIERRVDEMMDRGLLEEVRTLLALNPSITPMQAIGYKELAEHLAGRCTLDEAVRLIKRNTRRYAKRQYTWFRKEEGLNWVDVTGVAGEGEVLSLLTPVIEAHGIRVPD